MASNRANIDNLLKEIMILAHRLKVMGRKGSPLPSGGSDMLRTLADGGSQTVPQLARDSGLSRQAMQTLANKLVKSGWVRWQENPAHRRSPLAMLTPRGTALLEASRSQQAKWQSRLAKGVDEAELLHASEALSRLRALLENRPIPAIPPPTPPKVTREKPLKPPTPKTEPVENEGELPVNLL